MDNTTTFPSVHIYVDGSYLEGRVGYAMVAVQEDVRIAEYYGPVRKKQLITARQVGGEIAAVMRALVWCRERGIGEVTIHHDLEALEKWACGGFRTKQAMTVAYRDFVRNSGIIIHWVKVAAHTGDTYNERADALAKLGARETPEDKPSGGRQP